MTSTNKFLVAILLGVSAAAINAYLLSKKLEPSTFVMVKAKEVKQGDTFAADNLAKLELPNTHSGLKDALVPYDKRDLVLGQTAQRSYLAGDVIFWRDITPPPPVPQLLLKPGEELVHISLAEIAYEPELLAVGNRVSFVRQTNNKAANRDAANSAAAGVSLLGPFRIVSVGAKIDIDIAEDEDRRGKGRTETRTIGLAIPTDLDASSKEMLAATDRRAEGPYRLTHLVLHGSTPTPRPARTGEAALPRQETTSTAGR